MPIPEDIMTYMVFFYNKGQMFLPNPTKLFGSEFHLFGLPEKKLTNQYYRQKFKLTQTHWKALNTDNQRCDDEHLSTDDNIAVTECIIGYLEGEIGCSMGLQGGKPEAKRCFRLART